MTMPRRSGRKAGSRRSPISASCRSRRADAASVGDTNGSLPARERAVRLWGRAINPHAPQTPMMDRPMKVLVAARLGEAELKRRLAEQVGDQAIWVADGDAMIPELPSTDVLICPDN